MMMDVPLLCVLCVLHCWYCVCDTPPHLCVPNDNDNDVSCGVHLTPPHYHVSVIMDNNNVYY